MVNLYSENYSSKLQSKYLQQKYFWKKMDQFTNDYF